MAFLCDLSPFFAFANTILVELYQDDNIYGNINVALRWKFWIIVLELIQLLLERRITMDSRAGSQAPNAGSGKVAKPLLAWPPAYTYVNETCGSYGCRKCWYCVSTLPQIDYLTPSQPSQKPTDSVWITTSFFRFQDEARQYLALPLYNQAKRGMSLDLMSIGATNIQFTPCAADSFGNPGGAPEYQFIVSDSFGWTPLPVTEVFQTIPDGYTQQPAPEQDTWGFYFKQLS